MNFSFGYLPILPRFEKENIRRAQLYIFVLEFMLI